MDSIPLVINSGPLILLDRIDALDIPGRLPYRFFCPPAVRRELDAGKQLGRRAIVPAWLREQKLLTPVSQTIKEMLDPGESEVLQLALDLGIRRVCLDDLCGRKTAESLGLKPMGLLALLGRAKALGVIPRLKPLADRLVSQGAWYSQKVIQAVLTEVGE